MNKIKHRNMYAVVAILCVAVLASTSLMALVGSTNDTDGAYDCGSREQVTYGKLCGVANADGNLRNANNTYVDGNGYVFTRCNGSLDDGEFSCNYLTYRIYQPGDRVKVVDYSSDSGKIRSFSIPDYIDFNGTRYTVTEVDEWGMTSRWSIGVWIPLKVDIGPSIVKINKSAFSAEFSSTGLESFAIRNIELSHLSVIEQEAFYKTRINSIELPKNLTVIEKKAFKYSNVETVILHSRTLDIGYEAFYEAKVLKDINLENVRHIGEEAFYDTKLTDLDLSSATEIGKKAFLCDSTFRDTSNIHSIKFSPALTSLHEKAFATNAIAFDYYCHFYDTHGNELGQCAELMHGKTFVRTGFTCSFSQRL